MPDYLFFQIPFAILDYEKAAGMVFLENIVMLLFWVFAGMQVMNLLVEKEKKKMDPLLPIVLIMAAVIIGFMLNTVAGTRENMNESVNWQS